MIGPNNCLSRQLNFEKCAPVTRQREDKTRHSDFSLWEQNAGGYLISMAAIKVLPQTIHIDQHCGVTQHGRYQRKLWHPDTAPRKRTTHNVLGTGEKAGGILTDDGILTLTVSDKGSHSHKFGLYERAGSL